jgi:shikimate kinase
MIRIFLIGYMGAGKTTLGKVLARKLNLSFVDIDWFIESRFRKKIQDLFEERGEAGFRELERKILHEVAEFEDVIISTGGGAPCFFDNMDLMNRKGSTVFLDVQPDVLFRRLRITTASRPILKDKTDEELRAFIIQSLEGRLPFYTQAQYTFNTDELETRPQVNEAVRRLCEMLKIDNSQ